jgi:hypothetical protein
MVKMITKVLKSYLPNYLIFFVLWILILIGTFPSNDWTFSTGIDPPLFWVFNYLFDDGLSIGKGIIFPHGPLAFFMYPLQENIIISTIITSFLKGGIILNIYWLIEASKVKKWVTTFLLAYFISIISGFNHLVLCSLLLLYCNSYKSKILVFKYFAILITSFALFVKAYVGITALVIFISFSFYNLYNNKNIKQFLYDYLILTVSIILTWLLMYGTTLGLLNYFFGMLNLAGDNSSAASYYPYNNWFLLNLFFIVLTLIFIINKSKSSYFYISLIVLSLFAAWKHGMAREDIFHVRGFFTYVIICLSIFSILIKKHHLINFTLSRPS